MPLSLISMKDDMGHGNITVRSKRLSLEERKEECSILDKGKKVSSFFSDLFGDIPDIPIIGTSAKVALSGFKVVNHIYSFSNTMQSDSLDCDAIPFDEIKQILDNRFNEVDRKLDQMAIVLNQVAETVTTTLKTIDEMRTEMHAGFNLILETIESQEIKSIFNKIDTFVRYFENERNRIQNLPQREYVFKLEEKNSILEYLKDSRTPKENSLHSALFELIDRNNNFAIADNAEDTKAFMALYALYYGSQTYCSVMFFLLKQYSYLADYHYQNGDAEKFNTNFDLLKTTYDDFKFSLVGNKNSDAIIEKILEIVNKVEKKDFITNVKNEYYSKISKEKLLILKDSIERMKLDMIVDTPDPAAQISFKNSVLKTPLENWKKNSEVSYAVQLMGDGKYSRISYWTVPTAIKKYACPILKFPVDAERRSRLVFRRFDSNKPQLIGFMNSSQIEFRDIDRDLYDAAHNIYVDRGFNETKMLVAVGSNISAVFEHGRTALHAAAESGNIKVATLLLEKGLDVNVKDNNGYTALHVAATADQSDFAKFLLGKGADVNAATDPESLTPTHIASKKGFIDTLSVLMLGKNFNINKKEKFGFSPLHYAVQGGETIIKKLFSNNEVDANARTNMGFTPFHLSILKDDQFIADILLKTGKININEADDSYETALHHAAMEGNPKMLNYLLSLQKIDANPEIKDSKLTPLFLALYRKEENAILELLKDPKVNVNKIAKGNITPLHISISLGMENIVQHILEKNPDMEVKTDSDGYTPLHLAVSLSNLNATSLLIQHRANVNTKDKTNLTPLHLATKSGTTEMLAELLKNGANTLDEDGYGRIPAEVVIDNEKEKKDQEEERQIAIKKFEVFVDHGLNHTDLNKNNGYLRRVYRFINLKFLTIIENGVLGGEEAIETYHNVLKDKGLDIVQVLRKKWNDAPSYYFRLYDTIKKCINEIGDKPGYSSRLDECVNSFEIFPGSKGKRNIKQRKREIKSNFNSKYPHILKSKYHIINEDSSSVSKLMKSIDRNRIDFNKQFDKNQSLQNQALHPIDANSTLMLLDMIVRRFTDEKHKTILNEIQPDLEVQAKALNVIDKLQSLIDVEKKDQDDEEIDFAALHSQIYKTMKKGEESAVVKVLNSFKKSFLFDQ